jgi:hypothetical protein
MDWTSVLTGIVSGVVAGIAAAQGALRRQAAQEKKLGDLETTVATLKDEKIAGLSNRMDGYELRCSKHHDELTHRLRLLDQLAQDGHNEMGWLKKMDLKLDNISTQVAETRADLGAKGIWLSNLNSVVQDHVQNHDIHGRG